jgi:hypothetical protein
MALWVLAALFVCNGKAARHVQKATHQEEIHAEGLRRVATVDGVYTFGAPRVSKSVLVNKRRKDGCFPGYRMVRTDKSGPLNWVDPVSKLPTGWEHPKTAGVSKDKKNKDTYHPCGWQKGPGVPGGKNLHSRGGYFKFVNSRQKKQNPTLERLVTQAASISYEHSVAKARRIVKAGSKLMSTVLWDQDGKGKDSKVTHLIEDSKTKHCILTFEGSKTVTDWLNDANIRTEALCGLPHEVHKGFRHQLVSIVQNKQFQSSIKAKLRSCKKVYVAGHSLGGALAELFAACVNSGSKGDRDAKAMRW